jgi:hypothetical protein
MDKEGFSRVQYIEQYGYESIRFDYYYYYHNGPYTGVALLSEFLRVFPEHFGFPMSYQGRSYVVPFTAADYCIDNFIPEPAGITDVLRFYHALHPQYTEMDLARPNLLVLDTLTMLVNGYQSLPLVYYVFRYNYTDQKETVAFGKEQHQGDYFYLFMFHFEKYVGVGRLWYD